MGNEMSEYDHDIENDNDIGSLKVTLQNCRNQWLEHSMKQVDQMSLKNIRIAELEKQNQDLQDRIISLADTGVELEAKVKELEGRRHIFDMTCGNEDCDQPALYCADHQGLIE